MPRASVAHCLALLLLPVLASASSDIGWTFDAPGWLEVELHGPDGAPLQLTTRLIGGDRYAFGVSVVDEHGRPLYDERLAGAHGARAHAEARAAQAPFPVSARADVDETGGSTGVTSIGCRGCDQVRARVLVFAAGDVRAWEVHAENATARVIGQGDEARLMGTADFAGEHAGAAVAYHGASLPRAAAIDVDAPGRLVGFYIPPDLATGGATMRGPDGATRSCLCEFLAHAGPDMLPAGRYTFTLDGATAGTEPFLALVQLPP